MRVNRNETDEDFNYHLQTCVSTSLYWWQLNEYLSHFANDQFKIIIFEELINNYQQTLNEIFKFLGLPEYLYNNPFEVLHKSNRGTISPNALKYNKQNYNKLIELIKSDAAKMEMFLGRSIDVWDLSEETWMRE